MLVQCKSIGDILIFVVTFKPKLCTFGYYFDKLQL